MGWCRGQKELCVCVKFEGLGGWDSVEGRKSFVSVSSLKA